MLGSKAKPSFALPDLPYEENALVLLRHKCRLRAWSGGSVQHGHRESFLARATVICLRMVAIELGMCRSGRSGTPRLVTFG